MKTIQQRLQSRISKRRNYIRQMEQDVAVLVNARRTLRDIGFELSDVVYLDVSQDVRAGREIIKTLADDQRLDKRLRHIVSDFDFNRRYYELPDLT